MKMTLSTEYLENIIRKLGHNNSLSMEKEEK